MKSHDPFKSRVLSPAGGRVGSQTDLEQDRNLTQRMNFVAETE